MKTQKGFTLIEVMVSLLVLSIGALGLVGMQTRGLQFNQNSLYQSQATMHVMDMVDRIRGNKEEKRKYLIRYNESPVQETSCSASMALCTTAQMANYDLYQWRTFVEANLPSGKSKIEEFVVAGSPDLMIVTISFDDSKGQSPAKEFSMRVEI